MSILFFNLTVFKLTLFVGVPLWIFSCRNHYFNRYMHSVPLSSPVVGLSQSMEGLQRDSEGEETSPFAYCLSYWYGASVFLLGWYVYQSVLSWVWPLKSGLKMHTYAQCTYITPTLHVYTYMQTHLYWLGFSR